uniref:Glutaredoxin n=1 Tax=Pfiesteria piscicida TaxID=71001 RepID=A3E3J6_PFIPI|nr:glutaredoxin-like protein [Pfiesteria piscicida]ABI14264.1 glutaredoxin [Pfiesteria piscicida]ABI14265.1 glutaredoxin [Pfiesteria piscicida]
MGRQEVSVSQEEVQQAHDTLENLVKTEKCLIFSSTYCPWCDRAAEFFESLNRQCRKVELDVPAEGHSPLLGAVLAQATQQRTVPNTFLFGRHVGGFDRLLSGAERCRKDGDFAAQFPDVCGFLSE